MSRTALLVVNASSRRGAESAGAAQEALRARGFTVRRIEGRRAADLPAALQAQAAGADCIVVGGGDGTLNAVAPALIGTGLPLGVIPLGTANDLARTLGLPDGLDAAADVIAAGRQRRIDLGEVNGHPFFNVASIGFGVDLTRALTRDSKRRWGALGYAIAAVRAIGRFRPFDVRIVLDGQAQATHTVHLAVGNGRHYGGGMTVSEHARIDDGRLDIYSLEVRSLWHMLLLLPALRSGRHHAWAEIRTLAGQEIELRTRRPRSVNTDGEITTRTPARFRVLRGAVAVYAPETPPA